jgi:hypothetical protein
MMRKGSLGVRPRRGAWGKGSRRAKAAAAACLATLAVAAALPQGATAYPCGDSPTTARTPQLAGVSPDECRVPETLRRSKPQAPPKKKKGSVSALTVFVLAIAGALLIPIGRNGFPHGADPFGHDPTYEPNTYEPKF